MRMTMDLTPSTGTDVVHVANALVYWGDKVLLLQRDWNNRSFPGQWCFPGGKVERPESIKRAVVRELAEETGLHMLECEFTYWGERSFDSVYGTGRTYRQHYYWAQYGLTKYPPAVRISGNESDGFAWVSRKQAMNMDLTPGTAAFYYSHVGWRPSATPSSN